MSSARDIAQFTREILDTGPDLPGREFYRFAPRNRDDVTERNGAVPPEGLFSHNSLFSPLQLEQEALHGPVGDIVRAIEPHSEADPAAILVQLLVGFGNLVGRNAHFRVEADRHHLNLFAVLVGESSKARKGTSWGHVRRNLSAVDRKWSDECVTGGLSSGEGLIWSVRDPITERQPIKAKGRVEGYQEVETDGGVEDKRLLVVETEFGGVLQVVERDSNTLSAIVRQAWDNGKLRTMTKTKAATATDAHISIVGHVTVEELRRLLTDTQSCNGFANRFLWVGCQRSKLLPEGGAFHETDIGPLTAPLLRAAEFAASVDELRRDDGARELWRAVYPELSEGGPGLVGSLTSRAEAQTMRLAAIYAVLDRSKLIRDEHLAAALALWRYCEMSAEAIFGDALGDPVADAILDAVRSGEGMTRTEISNLLARHKSRGRIDLALAALQRLGLIASRKVVTGGRPMEVWYATAKEAKEAKKGGHA